MWLRQEDRLVIAYRYVFDLSEPEIAQVLGVARGAVKSCLSRALYRLCRRLRDLYPLLIAAPDSDASVREALVDLVAHLPPRPIRDLSTAVLGRIADGGPLLRRPSWTPLASVPGSLGLAALALVLLTTLVLALWRLVNWPSRLAAPRAGQ